MAENYTPIDVQTFVNDTSAVNTVNNNFAAISTAFTDVLSRSGVSPNQMQSTLDMNNNQIINLPPPSTINSPARLIDISGGQLTITTATTGTSGHAVPFLDGTNTWSAPQTITLPSLGTSNGIQINETCSGSIPGGYNANVINITDTINAGTATSSGFQVNQTFGSSSAFGGRFAGAFALTLNSATSATNTNRTYVGSQSTVFGNSADNGTNSNAAGTSQGSLVGSVSQVICNGSAQNLFQVNAIGGSITMPTSSSCWAKSLMQLSSAPSDVVNGTVVNTMIWLNNDAGALNKWTNALLIDNTAGVGVFPVSSTGTLIKATGGSVANGIDLTGMSFSGNAFVSPGFEVTSLGSLGLGGFGVSNGSISFAGSTSGFFGVSCNSTATLLTIGQATQIGVIGSVAGQLNIAGLTSGSAQITCSATGGSLQLGGNNLVIDSFGDVSTAGGTVHIANSSATPAGGATNLAFVMGSGNVGIYFGSGAPTISATQGSLYLRTDGSSTSTRLYVNTNGSTTWTNFTSAV